jgi:hypothetical protein
MKVEPGAADLLATARAALLEAIAPTLAEPQRYAVLMAANALAIAGRELAAPATAGEEIARLRLLLVDWAPAGDEAADLREGTARLAAGIRQGRFDEGERRGRLIAHLRATTRARLAVSNPRALER